MITNHLLPADFQGRFELLSLSGSFMPTENEGTRSRSGGLSVSLASPDGRVVGGGVAGLLVAAGPVQVLLFHVSKLVFLGFLSLMPVFIAAFDTLVNDLPLLIRFPVVLVNFADFTK